VSDLYAGTRLKGATDQTATFGKANGLTKAMGDKLQTDITEKLAALSEPLGLDAHELRDMNTVVLHHMLEVATGKDTTEKTDRWADAALSDLKTRHVSMRRVKEVIQDCNEWLKTEHPEVHRALKNSAGLGNHPSIVRKLTDRFLAHESETQRAGRGSQWIGKTRGDGGANPVPSGGLLAGNGRDQPSASFARRVRALQASDPSAGPENLPA
jgi:hypothetical protein